jgi:hypothetical protein
MAVTTTVYDINDKPWTLQIQGNTPDSLTLTADGIVIEYPDYKIDEPLILPKFTFNFVGDLEDIEAFGIIGQKTHPFTLTHTTATGTTYTWKGYLAETLFNVANTGFKEVVSINGISEVEALKYADFAMSGDDLVKISDIVAYCLTGVSYASLTYNLSFTLANLGHVATVNWYDEEGIAMNLLDVLKSILQFYSLILEQGFTTEITVSSYAQLFKQNSGIVNYNTVHHKGIDETYSNSENYMSATVVDSVLKPEDVLVNLSATESAVELPYLYMIRSYYWSKGALTGIRYKKHYREWKSYETRLHVIGENEFANWSFPHYSYGGNPIAEWWNPAAVINSSSKIPTAGMYLSSYRAWPSGVGEPAVGMTNMFLIKTFNRAGEAESNSPQIYDDSKVYASFSAKITTTPNNYLLFSGKTGFAGRWGDVGVWEDHSPTYYYSETCYEQGAIPADQLTTWPNGYITNGKYCDICVPLINRKDRAPFPFVVGDQARFTQMMVTIEFRGMFWSDIADDWTTSPVKFELPLTNSKNTGFEDINNQIADKYPPRKTPLYDSLGSGYALRFGKRENGTGVDNSGTGTLNIKLYFGPASPNNFYAQTFWLQDFNFNLVDASYEANAKQVPQSPTYQFGNSKEPEFSQINNYLMSSYENVASFSQIYTDAAGTNQLDTLNYSLPFGSSSIYTVNEKPEEHTLRIIKQVISNRIILQDIISFKGLNKQYIYNNKLLVRDSYTINALNNIATVNFIIRRSNYS